MFKSDGGFRHIPEDELTAAEKDGWVDGQPIWNAAMAAKQKDAAKSDTATIAKIPEVATMFPRSEVKGSPGRPRKEVPSVLNDLNDLNDGEV